MLQLIRTCLLTLWAVGPVAVAACGGAQDPSRIATGAYHLVLPDGWQGGPAVIYLHGYGSSSAKVLGTTTLVEGFTGRGYAFIAPTALPWREGNPTDWAIRDGWVAYPRNDLQFLSDVLNDAVARVAVDPDRVLLTGFSRGGSMVWEAACLHPTLARGYAAVAGGFWLPETRDCIGPVDLLHIHGFSDQVVPLEGRTIDNPGLGRFTQADIWSGLQLWRRTNGCPSKPSGHDASGEIWRRWWSCDAGSVEVVLHPGGHGFPSQWANLVLDWFEGLER
ncbi:polyhydroxybutyrate depolymerase [Pseudooceanicola lipolyticus]|uniref:Polyhydroxybutyrate depolymerase n=1 Tax=Pseudooceanicola lipolyticus TaxID=2029104 RepID=A0A2M8J5X0_9RHOB|nr:polyhydroxybutyrate depolymerase [Pseudooceanicola lipolyticus]PJE38181.1 polyhydroxybutyrate depolymerase [Pseudooceanicola lipolyticus]